MKESDREYQKAYNEAHKEEIKAQKKEYQRTHKEELKAARKIWLEEHKEERKLYMREYLKIYNKNRRESNPAHKLRSTITTLISRTIKSKGSHKKGSSTKYLPYTFEELRSYIENLFEPWMTWENYGIYNVRTWNDHDSTTWTWNIDHIIPQSTLPYISMEDENFKKCWSLENLRPYSAKQNLVDGNKR